MSNRSIVNTDEFRREALQFLKKGYYSDAPKRTKDYYDYWKEQGRRCHEGYSVGGMRITGFHYFYLNFCRILLVDKAGIEGQKNNSKVNKVQTFPAFWDGDYEYFWAIEIAEQGISEEEYKALELQTEIKDLSGGKHMVVLKARGKGYSYKSGSMLARNYSQGRYSKNYAVAEEVGYLTTRDGLLTKVWDNIAFLDNHTAWAQNRLKDTDIHKMCGYKIRTPQGYVEKGRMNQVIGVTIKDNPDKIRGLRGDLVFFEEAGKCPGLLRAWEIARPAFEQGAFTTGMMIAFGTGGSNEEGQEGLEELFNNPEANGCLPFNNIWDDGAEGTKSGFFIPAFQNYEGYIGVNGLSDSAGAKAYLENQRELKKTSPNPKVISQFVAEQPFTPQEAMMQSSVNMFPVKEIQDHKNRILREKRWQSMTNCVLIDSQTGIKTKIGADVPPPVIQFPAKKDTDSRGCIQITESPQRVNAVVPDDLYIIVHDPYAKDKTTGQGSLGATYVVKLWNTFSMTYMGCIVASYVGRPATTDDYNEQLFKLARYYNAKIGFENNRGTVISYAKQHSLTHWLLEEPTLDKKSRREGESMSYGITMSEPLKQTGEQYLRDWLITPIATDTEGRITRMYHTILDLALLTELTRFNPKKGNFDRVSSLLTGIYFVNARKQQMVVAPGEGDSDLMEFFNRQMF